MCQGEGGGQETASSQVRDLVSWGTRHFIAPVAPRGGITDFTGEHRDEPEGRADGPKAYDLGENQALLLERPETMPSSRLTWSEGMQIGRAHV